MIIPVFKGIPCHLPPFNSFIGILPLCSVTMSMENVDVREAGMAQNATYPVPQELLAPIARMNATATMKQLAIL